MNQKINRELNIMLQGDIVVRMMTDEDACEIPPKKVYKTTISELIPHAETTLDRIIGFINNSEGKTGITLTMVGVILTIIFTLGGENIMKMFSEAWNNLEPITGMFLVLFSLSFAFTLFGIYKLTKVLTPRLSVKIHEDEMFEKDSKIFFGRIASNNERYSQFRNKLLDYSDEDYLNDLWSQIYINSKICTKKFNYFYHGIRITIPSLLAMLAITVIFGFFILG